MIKVLVCDYDDLNGVSWWRSHVPLSLMRKAYREEVDIIQTDKPTVSQLFQADILLMFRPSSENALRIVENAKRIGETSGLKIIADIDDDLWNIPQHHHAFSGFSKAFDRMRAIYDMADIVWTSTEQLRYSIGDLGRAVLMPNAVHPGELPDEPAPYKGRACWRGSVGQVSDLIEEKAVKQYLQEAGKYENFIFWGYKPKYADGNNAHLVPYTDPISYFSSLRSLGANVFWKPLEVCKFNDAKSNIAWIEATLAGGVCVTNYAGSEGWEYARDTFTTDPDEIAHLWEQSRAAVRRDYNLLTVNAKRMESLRRAAGITQSFFV
jgi:hypothetical protein